MRSRWYWVISIVVGLVAAALASRALFVSRTEPGERAAASADLQGAADRAAAAPTRLRYDTEYPPIGYSTAAPSDPASGLIERIERGAVGLDFDASRGYLDAVLAALEIDVRSQVLVFSKTSLQVERITAATPRAIYFDDDTYVAWTQGADTLEIASLDPSLGPVFYTLRQAADAPIGFERQFGQCLRCHDSYSLTGGGVPRFITGSGYTDVDGNIVAHEGWILTSDRTPLRSRWGGWYVTGFHGSQVHLGNIAVRSASELQDLEALRNGNIADLDGVLDVSRYLTNTSDIVALLVLEHQVRAQNAIVRASYDARMAAYTAAAAGQAVAMERIAEIAEPLVEALFFVGEVTLTEPISGTSGFAEAFAARGPHDAQGRSLRELDLTTRLFKHALSYVIYSRAFAALPEVVKDRVYARIREILVGEDTILAHRRLGEAERAAVSEILRDTQPALFQALSSDESEHGTGELEKRDQ